MGYVFIGVPHTGYTKLCDGLFYISGTSTWEPPLKPWGAIPAKFINYRFGPLPYLRDEQNIFGVNLLANFPYGPYDIRDLVKKNVESHADQDSIAIINEAQSAFCEELLLMHGFAVINRTINPRHNSKISLYHRTPS